MKILAIETSCDETACAILEDGRKVLSNVVDSQIETHLQYGGIIPEIAARGHLEMVDKVVLEALHQAQLRIDDIDAFAATLGPGLVGSLLVGVQAAKALSYLSGKPFIGVNHLHGHIASNYLESDLEPPFICLLVSGGHTQLLKVMSYQNIELLGETLDDAVGEAYDKFARTMGLAYPGGPKIDAMAAQAKDYKAYTLPVAKTANAYDFSFSGLKTAVMRQFEKLELGPEFDSQKCNLAAAFQSVIIKALASRVQKAVVQYDIHKVVIAGGVAANKGIREHFQHWQAEKPENRLFYSPQFKYCTDNAAMIASAAFFTPMTNALESDVFSRQAHI